MSPGLRVDDYYARHGRMTGTVIDQRDGESGCVHQRLAAGQVATNAAVLLGQDMHQVAVFCQHTDCPTVSVIESGVNVWSSAALTVKVALLLAHRSGGELVESPQATAVRAKKEATSARLIRMAKNLR